MKIMLQHSNNNSSRKASQLGGMVLFNSLILKKYLLWLGVVALELDQCHFDITIWSWKDWFWTIFSYESMVMLKSLNLDNFYFGPVWWSLKDYILDHFYYGSGCWSWNRQFWIIVAVGGCCALKRTDLITVS